MKKKPQPDPDIVAFMAKIQEQLAVMDRKLDSFMTKSLTELAQARVVQKPPQPVQHSPQPAPRPQLSEQRPSSLSSKGSRPMYAVVCFDCKKNTEIPFKPSGDRPVYCKECFASRRAGNAPKVPEQKPVIPAVQPSAPVVAVTKPSVAKKKAASSTKKSPAKKKVVAKKKAKRK